MDRILFALLCGLAFGILDVAVMIPMKFENRRKKYEALSSAFIERFMLGFLIPLVRLKIHPALTGLILGVGLSVPTALITRAYAPIIGIGIVGGVVIGFITRAVMG